MSTANPKKRKRTESSHISIRTASAQDGIGPLLVSFPSTTPSIDTPFRLYHTAATSSTPSEPLIVGETSTIEYTSNQDENSRIASSSGSHYILAVHDPSSSTLTLLPPNSDSSQNISYNPHTLLLTTKPTKHLSHLALTSAPTLEEWQKAKTSLGETFGTKKAKASMRQRERNTIDANAVGKDVVNVVMSGIGKAGESLLTKEEAKSQADAARLIPPYDGDTEDTGDIYPLHNVIPTTEWKSLNTQGQELEESANNLDRIGMLPFKKSEWISAKLDILFPPTPPEDAASIKHVKRKLKILYYISILFAFRGLISKGNKSFSKNSIQEKLGSWGIGVPDIVIDGLFERFTEKERGSEEYRSTPTAQTLLLTYTFALILRLDGWASDHEIVARDLKMAAVKVKPLFETLGCKSKFRGGKKLMVLEAPVKFPEPRRKRATRR